MPAPLYQGPCASFVCCMGISGLGILFDLLWYVLVFGAAAVMAKWMIELHWTRAHTEYVTELLDCGRLSISERCSRVKTAVALWNDWLAASSPRERPFGAPPAGNLRFHRRTHNVTCSGPEYFGRLPRVPRSLQPSRQGHGAPRGACGHAAPIR